MVCRLQILVAFHQVCIIGECHEVSVGFVPDHAADVCVARDNNLGIRVVLDIYRTRRVIDDMRKYRDFLSGTGLK